MLRYKCLVLDHDDTVVDSTRCIHHPAFLEALKVLRPGEEANITLEEYLLANFDTGFIEFCQKRYGFTDEEFDTELHIWQDYVANHIPPAVDGMKELLWDYKEAGGIITVVSHSMDVGIYRDYEKNELPHPDAVFGWELAPELRKPSIWSMEQIAEKYDLKPDDMLMVDDLKHGFDMAHSFGAPFVGAGWCNQIPKIREFMKENCEVYFDNIDELRRLIFI